MLMYVYTWYQWLLFFFIYCFLGWIIETAYVSIKRFHFVNRGFLTLPLLPLYGTGAILMLWLSLPVQGSLLLVFLFGMVGASVLEYITGYVMERLFKMKYWDYSCRPLNLNGYICLGTSIAWGLLTIFLTEVVHRPMEWAVLRLSGTICIPLVLILSIVFILDAIHSIRDALDLGRILETLTRLKVELEEVQIQIALLKAETAQKISALKESALVERLQSLTEAREKLTHRLSIYRKGILGRNPTASSRLFGEALKELKEYSKKYKNHKNS